MKKVAIVMMLLAGSAFAAASLDVTPASQAPVNGQVTLMIKLVSDEGCYGLSVFPDIAAGKATFASYALQSGGDSNIPSTTLPTIAGRDAASISDWGWNGYLAAGADLAKVVLNVPAASVPLTIHFSSYIITDSIPDGADGNTVAVTITPEPASMLLLAAGAAFFARRRKA